MHFEGPYDILIWRHA